MTLTISSDKKDFLIKFDEADRERIENTIAQIIAGNFHYLDVRDQDGKTHFLPAIFIKDSYITIL